jgi:hypothetical protein
MTTLASLIGAIIILAGSVIAQSLEWLGKIEKYPWLKKIVEARVLRVILLCLSIGLFATVLMDVDAIRVRLSSPPPRPSAPAPINPKDLSCTSIQIAKPAPATNNNSGVVGSKVSGHDNSVVGSINQNGRNNIAQTGPNSTATINDMPPERRIKADLAPSLGLILASSRGRVDVVAMAGNNEAQQLGADIYALLKSSGWTMEHSIVMSAMKVGGPFEPGILIYRHGEPVATVLSLQNGDPLLVLKAFFEKAQLKFGFSQRLDVPEGVIAIEVGPAPKE